MPQQVRHDIINTFFYCVVTPACHPGLVPGRDHHSRLEKEMPRIRGA